MFSDLLDNVITFRKADATLEFATFEGDKAGDIWFQFKTTATDGVMIHDTGDTENDFIQIKMISKAIYYIPTINTADFTPLLCRLKGNI